MDSVEGIKIWTIGHSTRSIDDFIKILKIYNIELLADIRSFPGSKRYPHFNKNKLDLILAGNHIEYLHIPELGGWQNLNSVSRNSIANKSSFKSYTDYMATDPFIDGIKLLKIISNKKRTALMCAEANWRKCHRSMISDFLKSKRHTIIHIIDESKSEIHSYTESAIIIQEELKYSQKVPKMPHL
jgi:uncharacterized protein (DUF488 family)